MNGKPEGKPIRRKLDFPRIENKIQIFLYQRYLDSSELFCSFDEIAKGVYTEPRNAVWDTLSELVSDQKITQRIEMRSNSPLGAIMGGPNVGTHAVPVDDYKISRDGIEYVGTITDEVFEVLIQEVASSFEDNQKQIENDQWEPLPIDRETVAFSEAIEASERALAEIESNNDYAATDADERNSIVDSLKSHLELLKNGLLSRGQMLEGLVKPFRFIAVKFADASLGELAKRAANFLMNLLS